MLNSISTLNLGNISSNFKNATSNHSVKSTVLSGLQADKVCFSGKIPNMNIMKIVQKYVQEGDGTLYFLTGWFDTEFVTKGNKLELLERLFSKKPHSDIVKHSEVVRHITDTITDKTLSEQNGVINMIGWKDKYGRANGYYLFNALYYDYEKYAKHIQDLEKDLVKKGIPSEQRGQIIGDKLFEMVPDNWIKEDLNHDLFRDFMDNANPEEIRKVLSNNDINQELLEYINKHRKYRK